MLLWLCLDPQSLTQAQDTAVHGQGRIHTRTRPPNDLSTQTYKRHSTYQLYVIGVFLCFGEPTSRVF